MRRIIQFALLLAIIIPFGWMVRWGVNRLPEAAVWFGAGIPVGIAICYALWMWDNRIKERQSRGEFSRWD